MTTPGKLWITVGLPGAGKTTWARQFLAERPLGSVARVNRDDLRRMAPSPRGTPPRSRVRSG